jgi:hypothetical protein
VGGGRLLAVFTVQLDANQDIGNFPIIYTMGPVSNGVLQSHSVRAAELSVAAAYLLKRAACKVDSTEFAPVYAAIQRQRGPTRLGIGVAVRRVFRRERPQERQPAHGSKRSYVVEVE